MHYLESELQKLFKDDKDIHSFIGNAALDGVWFWDLQNPEHEWMSPQFWLTLGFEPTQKKHLASEWQDLINQDDLQTAMENFKRHCENPEHSYDQIVRYKHADGSTVWVRCRGIAIRDNNGNPVRMLGVHTDVTQLKLAELRYAESLKNIDRLYADTKLALEESEQVLNSMPDAIIEVDTLGNIIKTNLKACEIFGYSSDEFKGLQIDSLVPKPYQRGHRKNRDSYLSDPKPAEMTERKTKLKALRKDGSEVPVHIRLSPLQTKYGQHVLAIVRDITATEELQDSLIKSEKNNRDLYEKSVKDGLTSIYNRIYFLEQASMELEKAKRLQEPISILMVDIDDFKQINDTFGHQEGDRVLIEVSQTISSTLRSYDLFARYGGEEFIIMMPKTSADESHRVAQRIVEAISQKHLTKNSKLERLPTVSIGGVGMFQKEYDLERVISQADEELYKAKSRGKNQVSFINID